MFTDVPTWLKVLLLFGGIILPFFSILLTYLKDRKDNRVENKPNSYTNGLFFFGMIGLILSGLGTCVSEAEQKQSEGTAKLARSQDLKFQHTIDSLSNTNLFLSQTNMKLSEKNHEKINEEYDSLKKLSSTSRNLINNLNHSLTLQQANNKVSTDILKLNRGLITQKYNDDSVRFNATVEFIERAYDTVMYKWDNNWDDATKIQILKSTAFNIYSLIHQEYNNSYLGKIDTLNKSWRIFDTSIKGIKSNFDFYNVPNIQREFESIRNSMHFLNVIEQINFDLYAKGHLSPN